ncbi:pyruvate kinase [Hathewaya proteolytica DSM 3090]|uniref:Pyruvate kinase n=1 Tax=Hathewaya proteolytica DSM 3090 TaxID=1121331 RepID=A0A1M6NH00_9CLOT|nr:pyruvate kinase [Hathewaya proteolytica]SHJ95008.1 pyruvate kinase [Hathewaya proteolytica DSM 3090]
MKKTKMICTIGPSSNNESVIKQLILAGMNASRHNFSHGNHETHKINMDMVKKVRKELDTPVAILLDTKGPEIRTGNFEKNVVELKEKNKFTIYCLETILGDETKCSVTYENLYKDVTPGDKILIDDGLVGLRVEKIEQGKIHCVVINSGVVSNHKGVNVPGVSIKLPSLTEQDINDLKFAVEQDVDVIAASFIRTALDVINIRRTLNKFGGDKILIFSKIENQEGVDNIDKIIKYSDGIMVARGDLGVEIPAEEVPLVQKMIIEKCNAVGKPVITATQMLDSMMRNPRPTRAEASDVANAIFDGTDCVMLSGETAGGKYPVEAAETMARIAEKAESAINYEVIRNRKSIKQITVPDAISMATCTTAKQLNAKAIITSTQSGHTAKMVSKYRPESPIIAVTPYESVARKLALCWGVYSVYSEKVNTTDDMIKQAVKKTQEHGYVENGDLVVLTAGIPVNYVGSTNMIKVHIVGDVLVAGIGRGTCADGTSGTAKVVKGSVEATDIIEQGDVLVTRDIDMTYVEVLDKVSGIIIEEECDLAVLVLCEAKNVPVIYGAKGATSIIKSGSFVRLKIKEGIVYSGKSTLTEN